MNNSTSRHGPVPKSTPAFADGRIFTMGMSGIVTAFDAATGKQLWQKPKPVVPQTFHTAQSPIVDRGLMIIHVGGNNDGALTAFDPATGAEKWSWKGDGPGYGSPIIIDVDIILVPTDLRAVGRPHLAQRKDVEFVCVNR